MTNEQYQQVLREAKINLRNALSRNWLSSSSITVIVAKHFDVGKAITLYTKALLEAYKAHQAAMEAAQYTQDELPRIASQDESR